MKGVSPEELGPDSKVAPGSENRTRFLARFGVAGGVEIPCGPVTAVCKFGCDMELGPALLRLIRRTAMGCSSSVKSGKGMFVIFDSLE